MRKRRISIHQADTANDPPTRGILKNADEMNVRNVPVDTKSRQSATCTTGRGRLRCRLPAPS